MRAYTRFLFLLALSFISMAAGAQSQVNRYISRYENLAVEQMKKYQIPASVILGVSIIESGAGTSKLARYFNNHFGIKGPSKNSVEKLGYRSAYREYASDTASYEHFCNVLSKKKFYTKIKGETNYKLWLQKMMEANYSTAPEFWLRKITATIAKYKLYEYDEL